MLDDELTTPNPEPASPEPGRRVRKAPAKRAPAKKAAKAAAVAAPAAPGEQAGADLPAVSPPTKRVRRSAKATPAPTGHAESGHAESGHAESGHAESGDAESGSTASAAPPRKRVRKSAAAPKASAPLPPPDVTPEPIAPPVVDSGPPVAAEPAAPKRRRTRKAEAGASAPEASLVEGGPHSEQPSIGVTPAMGAEPAEPAEAAVLPRARRARKAPPVLTFKPPETDRPAPVDAPTARIPDPPSTTAEIAAAAAEAAAGASAREPDGDQDGDQDGAEQDGGTRRRRRRGRRGRGRGRADGDEAAGPDSDGGPDSAHDVAHDVDHDAEPDAGTAVRREAIVDAAAADAGAPPFSEDTAETEESEESDEADGATGTRRRRRRRRRRGSGTDEPEGGEQAGEVAAPRARTPRTATPKGASKATEPDDEGVRGVSGSTRLEAKRQRRREGRDQGRRRPPILSEAEFLARREAVERVMVVRQTGERTQIGVLEDDVLVEHYVTKASSASYAGNIYLGRVQNVLPSMEAAFVDIGKGRNAVLYAGEVNFDASGLEGRSHRIERALKSGQSVLVQVSKDPIGHKGARLTSQISLPGRYLVYVPEGKMTGISRKLPDNERSRLKGILKKIVPDEAGVIIRTAAEGASEEELTRDVARLQAQWADIATRAEKAGSSAPTLLYAEPDLVVRVIRDIFNEDFASLVVQAGDEWDTIAAYVERVAPDLAPRLSRYAGDGDIFAEHRIDEQLAKALDRKVWLPSGGSLVIDRTEAMVVIDVNTGKFTGAGGNLEETVTKNNLEAAEEIVRQLRLRDLGGIIVIDFIDMVLESNRDLVLRRLTECLGRDRTKHQVAEVTSLGLVQMTRKRVGQGLLESFSKPCPTCNGRGVQVYLEPVDDHGGPTGVDTRSPRRTTPADVAIAVRRQRDAAPEPTTASVPALPASPDREAVNLDLEDAVETAVDAAHETVDAAAQTRVAAAGLVELAQDIASRETSAGEGTAAPRRRRRAGRAASRPAGPPPPAGRSEPVGVG